MDKIAKIRSQPAKYNLFCRTEASIIIGSEKIVKNHLWEVVTILRGKGRLATKINITFFVRNEILNIFHLSIFS